MPASSDLINQLSFAIQQGSQNSPLPTTIASATTAIAPTQFITFITGTAQLGIITPPLAGPHMLVFIFTDASPGAFTTGGNIKTAYTPIQNRPIALYYDPSSAKYWVAAVV